jgi:hypothetical protein
MSTYTVAYRYNQWTHAEASDAVDGIRNAANPGRSTASRENEPSVSSARPLKVTRSLLQENPLVTFDCPGLAGIMARVDEIGRNTRRAA